MTRGPATSSAVGVDERPGDHRPDDEQPGDHRPDHDRAEVASRLRFAVTRLARLLRQQTDVGLTPTKLAQLATIARDGPTTLGDLAAVEHVSPPTVTKCVSWLEDHDLVQRHQDPDDRRVVLVQATDQGHRQLEELQTLKTAWLATRLERLDDDEVHRLAGALELLEDLARTPQDRPRPTT